MVFPACKYICMVSKDVVGSRRAFNCDFWFNAFFPGVFVAQQNGNLLQIAFFGCTTHGVSLLVQHHCTIYCIIVWFDLPMFSTMHEIFIFGFLCTLWFPLVCVPHNFQTVLLFGGAHPYFPIKFTIILDICFLLNWSQPALELSSCLWRKHTWGKRCIGFYYHMKRNICVSVFFLR